MPKETEVAKQADVLNHIRSDWMSVHGIWPGVRPQIPSWTRSLATIAITANSAWHEVTVVAGATLVLLSVNWTGDADEDTMLFYTRKLGSSETYEGIARGENCHGSMIWQELDEDGKFEYYCTLMSGSIVVKRWGYLIVPL